MMYVAQSWAIPELQGEKYLVHAATRERGCAVLPGELLGLTCHSTNRLRPKKTCWRVRVVLWVAEKGQSQTGPCCLTTSVLFWTHLQLSGEGEGYVNYPEGSFLFLNLFAYILCSKIFFKLLLVLFFSNFLQNRYFPHLIHWSSHPNSRPSLRLSRIRPGWQLSNICSMSVCLVFHPLWQSLPPLSVKLYTP